MFLLLRRWVNICWTFWWTLNKKTPTNIPNLKPQITFCNSGFDLKEPDHNKKKSSVVVLCWFCFGYFCFLTKSESGNFANITNKLSFFLLLRRSKKMCQKYENFMEILRKTHENFMEILRKTREITTKVWKFRQTTMETWKTCQTLTGRM